MFLANDLTYSHSPAGSVVDRFGQLSDSYARWTFESKESDGFVPMAAALDAIRSAGGAAFSVSRARIERSTPRFVNGSLWHGNARGRARLDPRRERVEIEKPYELVLQIGDLDELIPVYLTSPFEEIPRIEGKRGVWVEVAVNGVGFEVLGDPVQALYLPFEGASDVVRFAVVPKVDGAAFLRYTIYYQQSVVQTPPPGRTDDRSRSG